METPQERNKLRAHASRLINPNVAAAYIAEGEKLGGILLGIGSAARGLLRALPPFGRSGLPTGPQVES